MRNKLFAAIDVRETPGKGKGLFASEDLEAGAYVREYVGEIIDEDELTRRRQARKGDKHMFVAYLKDGSYLDATDKGSITRFINHSCEPNCRFETWNVSGHYRIGIFATKSISAHTELTFDYKWDYSVDRAPTKCLCGAPSCRGFLEVLSQVCSISIFICFYSALFCL